MSSQRYVLRFHLSFVPMIDGALRLLGTVLYPRISPNSLHQSLIQGMLCASRLVDYAGHLFLTLQLALIPPLCQIMAPAPVAITKTCTLKTLGWFSPRNERKDKLRVRLVDLV